MFICKVSQVRNIDPIGVAVVGIEFFCNANIAHATCHNYSMPLIPVFRPELWCFTLFISKGFDTCRETVCKNEPPQALGLKNVFDVIVAVLMITHVFCHQSGRCSIIIAVIAISLKTLSSTTSHRQMFASFIHSSMVA